MTAQDLKIYIAGHTGLVGSALVRYFSKLKSTKLILAKHSDLDLTRQEAVESFFSLHKPDVVFLAAGRVGGIQANSRYPAEFIYQNLMIEANVIHAAWKFGVKRLVNFGSSCIYPKQCPQPMIPESLMMGKLEETNEPYAIAKFAGLSLCTSYNQQYSTKYINIIPSNLYGPNDAFDLERAHVVASFIRKFHEAKEKKQKEVVLWGSGHVQRDFLYVDDFVEATHLLLQVYEGSEPINVGAESPCMIRDLVTLVSDVVGFEGRILWDTLRPDGAPQRNLGASEIRKLGWSPKTDLKSGLSQTYRWFLQDWDRQNIRSEACVSL